MSTEWQEYDVCLYVWLHSNHRKEQCCWSCTCVCFLPSFHSEKMKSQICYLWVLKLIVMLPGGWYFFSVFGSPSGCEALWCSLFNIYTISALDQVCPNERKVGSRAQNKFHENTYRLFSFTILFLPSVDELANFLYYRWFYAVFTLYFRDHRNSLLKTGSNTSSFPLRQVY